MKESGSIFFKDEYDQIYITQWSTSDGKLDITSVVKQPYVWGKDNEGYIRNGVLFRKGIVTIRRQILTQTSNGYIIISEGSQQSIEDIQMNYPCSVGPVDNFRYHFDNNLVEEVSLSISDGSSWASPSDGNDVIWGEVEEDGSVIDSNSDNSIVVETMDVWT